MINFNLFSFRTYLDRILLSIQNTMILYKCSLEQSNLTPNGEITMTIDTKQRSKAIDAAISALSANFGKGSIMRLGEENLTRIPVTSTGCLGLDIALELAAYQKAELSRSTVQRPLVKQPLLYMPLRSAKKRAVLQHSLMPNTHWTQTMQPISASILMTCWFHNPTLVSKPLKSLTRLCAQMPSTSSLWTPSPRLFRDKSSKAIWEIMLLVHRHV